MPLLNKSILAVDDITDSEVTELFRLAQKIKANPSSVQNLNSSSKLVVTMFLEPSTRTRLSFHVACSRMNLKFTDFGNEGASSLSKGETPEDTLYNVAAMKPDLMVVRYGSQPSIHRALQKISVPIISGGGGATEHPTQALLDAFTIEEKHGSLKGQKILFVGDVLHSRVAHSGIKLFSRMGAEVATACPESLMRSDALVREHKHFIKLDEAIKWADVVMGLRIQKERHSDMTEDFSEYYLSASVLSSLKKDGLIIHPGPFIPGHDMDREVLADSRCVIHRQVENGVYVRMALMAQILGVNL